MLPLEVSLETIEELPEKPLCDNENPSAKRECSVCGKIFTNCYLEIHMRLHTEEKPHKCLGCGKGLIQSHTLKGHMLKVHGTSRFFQCLQCQKVLKNMSHLKRHLLIHTAKPHNCPQCHMCFSQKSSLEQHLIRHTTGSLTPINDKKECQICNKMLSTYQALRHHMLIHTGEKPQECIFCQQRFRQKANLAVHVMKMRMHNGPKHSTPTVPRPNESYSANKECQICKKVFKSPNNLREHLRIHTGEKPYHCSYCDMRFWSRSIRWTHEQTHLKPIESLKTVVLKKRQLEASRGILFECDTCKKVFQRKSSLTEHKRIHWNDTPFCCQFCPMAFKFAAGLFHHCRKVHNTGYQKSTDTATIVPSLQTLRPPALIANLFDRCGIVLERFDFVEEALAKGRCTFELDELPDELRDY